MAPSSGRTSCPGGSPTFGTGGTDAMMKPSASAAASRSVRSPVPATRRRGRPANPGVMPGAAKAVFRASMVTRRRSKRASLSGGITPWSAGNGIPLPRLISTRPPLTRSRVASSLATVAGFQRPVLSTKGASPIVVVARATAAKAISGDKAPGRSASTKLSNPARSARCAVSTTSSTDPKPEPEKPKRNPLLQTAKSDTSTCRERQLHYRMTHVPPSRISVITGRKAEGPTSRRRGRGSLARGS